MDILKALKPVEAVEAGLAELYSKYCGQLSEDPDAAGFFAKLSHDEKVHQQTVQYELRLVSRNPRQFESVEIDVASLENTLKEIEYFMHADKINTLQEMVRVTLEFENSTAESYYRTAMVQANAEVGQFLQSMGLASAKHLKFAQEFAEKRGFIQTPAPKRSPTPREE